MPAATDSHTTSKSPESEFGRWTKKTLEAEVEATQEASQRATEKDAQEATQEATLKAKLQAIQGATHEATLEDIHEMTKKGRTYFSTLVWDVVAV